MSTPTAWPHPTASTANRTPGCAKPTALLPCELERRRGAVAVVDALPVKARPTTRVEPGRDQLRTLDHLHARSDVLAHVTIGHDDGYVLVDKATPHGLYEVMVMSATWGVLAGLHQHSRRFHAAFGALVVAFVAHCRQYGLYPTVGWSYDPDTHDRESIQGEKRFHAHLIGRSHDELAFIGAHAKPAARCSATRRRRICEEASVIGALVVGDLLKPRSLGAVELVAPLSSATATISVQVRLKDGWAAFARPSLFADLACLHVTFQRAYTAVVGACAVGAAGRWQRPRVQVDPERLAALGLALGPSARAALGHYLRALRPEVLDRTPPPSGKTPATVWSPPMSTRWLAWPIRSGSPSMPATSTATCAQVSSPTWAAPA